MDNVSLFFLIFNLNGQSRILDQLMIFGATYLIFFLILLVFILGLKGETKDKKAFLIILLGLPIAVLLVWGIHLFFIENRPFVTFNFTPLITTATDASFPSRHATISALIAFSYTYFKSKWAPIFLLVMLFIGIARIFVGVHYPFDILGGFATAAISVFITLYIKKLLQVYLLHQSL